MSPDAQKQLARHLRQRRSDLLSLWRDAVRRDPELTVEGDPLKLQRIVQNLLLHSVKATQHGGVSVRWATESDRQWTLSIADTGPGFALQSLGPLRHALKRATDEAHQVAAAAAADRDAAEPQREPPPAAGSGPGSASLPAGEGIGLSIVKRLCEVLGATIELDTAPGRGTTIRISFPRYYTPAGSTARRSS
jgi:signal transduction histidine kinase